MDRRVRRTRDALYSAFIALIAERGYDRISIQDIVDAADVGRTTFYAHFKDRDDLLRMGFDRLREELLASFTSIAGEAKWAFLTPLLTHAKYHAGLYAALIGGAGGQIAQSEFKSVVQSLVEREVGSKGHMSTMLAGALLAAIQSWVELGGKGDGNDIEQQFRELAASVRQWP